ncbi:MAG: HlyD family efflux transporter periplasmic adaptor subunit [Planctomycetales bacterium]|nr:HlyD family efflux transporter periplasmic adaptor subunit [Planctomycetales bacterium]
MVTLNDSLVSSATRKLPLRMRPDLSMRYHKYQGKPYWVIKEPIGLKYYRFQEEEFSILQMLDGTVSFQEIKDRFEKDFAPQKITLGDLQHFIGMLHRSGLLITGAEGQGRQLKNRRDETKRKELLGKLSNVLAIRFKGIDPEKLLNAMAPFTNWYFTKWAVMVVAFIGICALLLIGTNFTMFRSRLPAFHEFFGPQNWLWLGITMGLTKVLHEFGHGLSCKRFGGECHEMGVMFLVLTPCLYCNVSDSWLLPSKWHRAAIGAAGMYVELTLASIATFLWWFSDEASTINQISLSVMFICSVSTVLFNGNPLLRFDGYYIMSDLSEIPNLRQKSSKILQRYMAEYCLGLEQQDDPFLPQGNQLFFAMYTVAAVIYRWVVVFSILMFLNSVLEPYGLQVVGRVIACMGLFGLVIQPMWQLGKFLHVPGRMHQVKRKNILITLAILFVLVAAFCTLPLPYSVKCSAQVQPRDAKAVYAGEEGILTDILVEPGQKVDKGTPIAKLRNIDLELQLLEARSELASYREQLDHAKRSADVRDRALVPVAKVNIRSLETETIPRLEDQSNELTVTAPIAGTVIVPRWQKERPTMGEQLPSWSGSLMDKKNLGATLSPSDIICYIGDEANFEAELAVDQSDIDYVYPGQNVRIRLEPFTNQDIDGTIESEDAISRRPMEVTPEHLSFQAGGTIATETDPSTGVQRPLSATYQVFVPIQNPDRQLVRGMRGRAKIKAEPQSLGQRLYRYAMKTFRFDL